MATKNREFHRFLLMAQFEAKEIGARIAQARKEAGLTQEELAELAPFSYRSLQDYERGLTIPYRQLRDISKLLGQPVEWFLRGDEAEEPALLARLEAIERKIDELPQVIRAAVAGLGVARSGSPEVDEEDRPLVPRPGEGHDVPH